MTTLTVLGGQLDHTPMTPLGSPTAYLLTAAPELPRAASKIAPKRQRSDSVGDGPPAAGGGKRRALRTTAAPAVARRNERERNRVRQVNMGFATLRQHVPNGAKSKKMSKVETLRSAVQYIKQLQQLLREEGAADDENSFEEQFRQLQPQQFLGRAAGSPASSPDPSLGSDASSPYDSLSPEDEELLDFTTWLS